MRENWDYLIVGAGFTGATLAERIARELDARVLVIDRRSHIGGNAWDEVNSAGLRIGRYGVHVFHTQSQKVWDYVTRFADFNHFVLEVEAYHQGRWYSLPLNRSTINAFFEIELKAEEIPTFLKKIKVPIEHPQNAEEAVLSRVGKELYEAFYLNYTRKQWDLDPRELDASVTMRLPIRSNDDRRYFTDRWQGVPSEGYAALFEGLLNHPRIEVRLNTDYQSLRGEVACRRLIYTGPIDSYFHHQLGRLPYRSLNFEFETVNQAYAQHKAMLNYPNDHAYTRSIEFKQIYQQQAPVTTLCREYPCWNDEEPYYPVPAPQNSALFQQYRTLAQTVPHVLFCGRLGSYQYLNMDQCIAQALKIFEQTIAPGHQSLTPILFEALQK